MCLTSMVGLVIEKMSQYLSDGLSLWRSVERSVVPDSVKVIF